MKLETTHILLLLIVGVVLFLCLGCSVECSSGATEGFYEQQWTCDDCLQFCDAGDPAMCTVLCQDVCQDQGCRQTCLAAGGTPQQCNPDHPDDRCPPGGSCPCRCHIGCMWNCTSEGKSLGDCEHECSGNYGLISPIVACREPPKK